MKYYLIMNPGSQGGRSEKEFKVIHNFLKQYDISYDYKITQSLEDAYTLSQNANKASYDVIIAVGGDGTINRVLNGFYRSDGTRISKAKFGVIYTGTSPDFCKSYHIPIKIEEAVKALKMYEIKEIGIGRIEFENDVKFFACCVNIGLGASLANHANSGIRKLLGDYGGTFIALIRTLLRYKPIDVKLNGCIIKHVYNISIGKTFYIASGLKIKNELKSRDDRFYILTIQGQIIKFMWKLYQGREVSLEYKKDITIEGTELVEFDGDEGGVLPCRITAADNLDLICANNTDIRFEGSNE